MAASARPAVARPPLGSASRPSRPSSSASRRSSVSRRSPTSPVASWPRARAGPPPDRGGSARPPGRAGRAPRAPRARGARPRRPAPPPARGCSAADPAVARIVRSTAARTVSATPPSAAGSGSVGLSGGRSFTDRSSIIRARDRPPAPDRADRRRRAAPGRSGAGDGARPAPARQAADGQPQPRPLGLLGARRRGPRADGPVDRDRRPERRRSSSPSSPSYGVAPRDQARHLPCPRSGAGAPGTPSSPARRSAGTATSRALGRRRGRRRRGAHRRLAEPPARARCG